MKFYLSLILFGIGFLACLDPGVHLSKLSSNTYRMNQNIHSIPSNGKDQQELIDKYLSMGYGGFTVNVSNREYLTDSGMTAFKSFCDKAKINNMELWLYDELGYPSGNAGGRVILQNREWEAKGIFKRDTLINEGEVSFVTPPGQIIKAVAINQKDTIDLQKQVRQGRLIWDVPKGTWKVLIFSKHNLYHHFQASQNPNVPKEKLSSHYPSLMIPEVTKAFIKSTHEKYVDYLGEDLGKYFVSTFTDEPSLMAVAYPPHPNWSVIPWSSNLSETIKLRYGYCPEDNLLKLFEDEGPIGQKIRYQYFHTVGELISINYFQQIKDWCTTHNLKSGGHLLLEETMMAHVPLYGDLFACFRQMDVPGIDALSCIPENTPVHAPKLASSVAELIGASRVMCEPNTIVDRIRTNGKEPDIEHVRGFFNIQLAGGITDFNNYLKFSDASNEEKKEFNNYVGEIAKHLRGGHSVADIAVLYPIESLWVNFIPKPLSVADWDSVTGGSSKAVEIEQSFRNTARKLYDNRWEYNFIDTKAIENSQVKNGTLVHGNLKWKIVILPNVSTLSILALEKLHNFVKSGGFLISIGQTPVNSTVNFPDLKIKEMSEDIFKMQNAINMSTVHELFTSNTLERCLKKDFIVEDKNAKFRFTHRKIDGSHVYFVFNDSDKTIECNISLRDLNKALLFDPIKKENVKIKGKISLKLEPYHGVIFTSL